MAPRNAYLDKIRERLSAELDNVVAMNSSTKNYHPSTARQQRLGYPIRPIVEMGGEGAAQVKSRKIPGSSRLEHCLVEASSNSVRISFCFKQSKQQESPTATSIKKLNGDFKRASIAPNKTKSPVLASQNSALMEHHILQKYMATFQQRASSSNKAGADCYSMLRKKPVETYSVSFLILATHIETFGACSVINWIVDFCSNVDKEVSDIKLAVNARARSVANDFFQQLAAF